MIKYFNPATIKAYIKTGFLVSILSLAFVGLSCNRETLDKNPNQPPNTTIANIPVEGDTLFALISLSWDGGDDDGYIDGYKYRYTTEHMEFDSAGSGSLVIVDTVVQPWKWTGETSLTIAFNSSSPLNRQTFEVRAVDNRGDEDPTSAQKQFYTRLTYVPVTSILVPANNQKLFFLEQTTDWWPGILLRFTGYDRDGEIEEYGYSIDEEEDDIHWLWTQDTSFYLTPDMFQPPLEGNHIVRVTARDNTNLVDPVGSQVSIRMIAPTFNKDILIIDETDENRFPTRFPFTDDEVDSFYTDIFGGYDNPNHRTIDSWDFEQNAPFLPALDSLGQYKLVVWHADGNSGTDRIYEYTDYLEGYLNVGGNLMVSGWKLLRSLYRGTEAGPDYSFADDSFASEYLHVKQFYEGTRRRDTDFRGAYGAGADYSDIKVDSVKLVDTGDRTYNHGTLSEIDVITEKGAFTETIYTYQSRDNDGNTTQLEGTICGIRYYGTSFNTVVLGFPVFLIEREDARTMVNEILTNLGL